MAGGLAQADRSALAAEAAPAAVGQPAPLPVEATALGPLLLAAGVTPAQAAVELLPLDGGALRARLNADQPRSPASTMKLVTSIAALDLLGPEFRWSTRFAARAAPQAGRLAGPLYLKGGGDPQFRLEDLWASLRELRLAGVRSLDGALVVDRSLFRPLPHDDGAFDGEPLRSYNAGADAALLGWKARALHIAPAGERIALTLDPPDPAHRLVTRLRLVDRPCGDWKAGVALSADAATLTLSGDWPRSCGAQTWWINLGSHDDYLLAAIDSLWRELGGQFAHRPTLTEGEAPADAVTLVERESAALAETLVGMNKQSNNVMARQLFLMLGARRSGPGADETAASAAVADWLAARGFAFDGLVIENGAGLSRLDRIRAGDLAALLAWAWRMPFQAELVASLPIVGRDGTMRRRLADAAVPAHIKSGAIDGTRAVAGYVQALSGRRYALVGIVNGAEPARANAFNDALIRWVAENG
ncbi:D-alanyl-D-alanine carboxypeptidase/D-alanyl-D-alanine endopeptidase [Derxia lacustris]|uniref:D-alanyl-D-alanine carboxypeptidase/D-alanyl-D-alanine endopeptidase n=1 Tax=Derxia lacustris TaxID=764842 RepID=UPI000A173991|nr:D-alanyl-D-alanine carboxypeptidase/D-alanyl-D-alanine-endopeptidase [Derxia lacustris]